MYRNLNNNLYYRTNTCIHCINIRSVLDKETECELGN